MSMRTWSTQAVQSPFRKSIEKSSYVRNTAAKIDTRSSKIDLSHDRARLQQELFLRECDGYLKKRRPASAPFQGLRPERGWQSRPKSAVATRALCRSLEAEAVERAMLAARRIGEEVRDGHNIRIESAESASVMAEYEENGHVETDLQAAVVANTRTDVVWDPYYEGDDMLVERTPSPPPRTTAQRNDFPPSRRARHTSLDSARHTSLDSSPGHRSVGRNSSEMSLDSTPHSSWYLASRPFITREIIGERTIEAAVAPVEFVFPEAAPPPSPFNRRSSLGGPSIVCPHRQRDTPIALLSNSRGEIPMNVLPAPRADRRTPKTVRRSIFRSSSGKHKKHVDFDPLGDSGPSVHGLCAIGKANTSTGEKIVRRLIPALVIPQCYNEGDRGQFSASSTERQEGVSIHVGQSGLGSIPRHIEQEPEYENVEIAVERLSGARYDSSDSSSLDQSWTLNSGSAHVDVRRGIRAPHSSPSAH